VAHDDTATRRDPAGLVVAVGPSRKRATHRSLAMPATSANWTRADWTRASCRCALAPRYGRGL
jgi:hypothetical protein